MLNKLLILPLFFISTVLIGQSDEREVFKLKAISMAQLSADTNFEWSDWKPIEDFIILNPKLERIHIARAGLYFDIIDGKDLKPTQKNADIGTTFEAYDSKGNFCNIDFIIFENGNVQMYFNYKEFRWVFDLRFVD